VGRQINFCMEEENYKQIVDKALSMGFVVLYQECVGGEKGNWKYDYRRYDKMPGFPLYEQHYFYNPHLGNFIHCITRESLSWEQIKEQKLNLGSMFAPLIEAGCSEILQEDKAIRTSRLYIRSDYYDAGGVLIKQSEEFLKQYNALVRAVKKLVVMREIPYPPPHTGTKKVYVTDYMFKLSQDGYDIR